MRDYSVTVLAIEPEKVGIRCFDVNEQRRIAVGQNVSNQNRICVYDEEGNFLYGYSFSDFANSFDIEWDNDNINVYMHRSRLIFSVDPQGNILEVKKYVIHSITVGTVLLSCNQINGMLTESLIRLKKTWAF